jgi:hypothetical protein
MKYLCLVYQDETMLGALSESDYELLAAESLAYDEEIRRSGRAVSLNALARVQTATTVRVGNGQVSISDGPFAETREQLGGFLLIEARDLNDAIRVASKIPPARLGCVEVRPIMGLPLR